MEVHMSVDNQTAVQIFYKMMKARLFEQEAYRIKERGIASGPLYLSIGQEATVAAVMALNPQDIIFASHRNFHIMVGADVSVEKMFRELIGDSEGICGGRSGCFSAADNSVNFYGSSALVGAQFGKAVGVALSLKLQGKNNCVVCFAGDGAVADGSFYEALNAGCLNKLPLIFFIENNCYAGSVKTEEMHNVKDLATRASGFDIPGIIVDGNDAIQIYEAMIQAMNYAQTNSSPVILESKTYRLSGHTTDDDQSYREDNEIKEWLEYDAIDNLSRYLVENGIGIADDLMMMREKIESEMKAIANQIISYQGNRRDMFDFLEGVR
jgi:pyruvate dehydrogenase E1 component alpha subunit